MPIIQLGCSAPVIRHIIEGSILANLRTGNQTTVRLFPGNQVAFTHLARRPLHATVTRIVGYRNLDELLRCEDNRRLFKRPLTQQQVREWFYGQFNPAQEAEGGAFAVYFTLNT